MVELLCQLLLILRSLFESRARLEAEITVLRQQLDVLGRRAPKRIRLRNWDRFVFVWLHRTFPSILGAITIVKPETVIRWHRDGFGAYWRWKSRQRAGRPMIDREIRQLVRQMSIENPLWGEPRIHRELLMFGIRVAQSTVAKYIDKPRQPPSQSWKTFLRNQAAGIASIDLFVVRTVSFKLLYGLVILRHVRRRIVTIGVTSNRAAEWIAGQVTEAFPCDEAPRYLLSDRDCSYGYAFTRRVRAMGICDRPTALHSPWQNGHVERLIGSIRRECLDHLIVFGETHLRRILAAYASYYNEVRAHLSLNKDAPVFRRAQFFGKVASLSVLGSLHHHYIRI